MNHIDGPWSVMWVFVIVVALLFIYNILGNQASPIEHKPMPEESKPIEEPAMFGL
jgi:hypothetical protein